MPVQESLLDLAKNAVRADIIAVSDSVLATYISSTTSVQITNSSATSGAAAVMLIAALVPSGAVNATNQKTIKIERIIINWGFSTGSGKPSFEFRVQTASGATAGTARPILPHNQGDATSTMQLLQAPTAVGSTAWVLNARYISGLANGDGQLVLSRSDFPGGKPITLRSGFAEGLFFNLVNLIAGTWPIDNGFTVSIVWSEA